MPPRGRPPGARTKPWQDALEKAARELDPETGEKKLLIAARKTVAAAMAGDQTAAKELGDRLDGKAHQSSDIVISDDRMVVSASTPAETAEEWEQKHRPH